MSSTKQCNQALHGQAYDPVSTFHNWGPCGLSPISVPSRTAEGVQPGPHTRSPRPIWPSDRGAEQQRERRGRPLLRKNRYKWQTRGSNNNGTKVRKSLNQAIGQRVWFNGCKLVHWWSFGVQYQYINGTEQYQLNGSRYTRTVLLLPIGHPRPIGSMHLWWYSLWWYNSLQASRGICLHKQAVSFPLPLEDILASWVVGVKYVTGKVNGTLWNSKTWYS